MTWQAALTILATIITSGAVWQALKVRSEIRNIQAQTAKAEEETATIAFDRMRDLAEYYRQRLEDCLDDCEGRHPPPPPVRKGRL